MMSASVIHPFLSIDDDHFYAASSPICTLCLDSHVRSLHYYLCSCRTCWCVSLCLAAVILFPLHEWHSCPRPRVALKVPLHTFWVTPMYLLHVAALSSFHTARLLLYQLISSWGFLIFLPPFRLPDFASNSFRTPSRSSACSRYIELWRNYVLVVCGMGPCVRVFWI